MGREIKILAHLMLVVTCLITSHGQDNEVCSPEEIKFILGLLSGVDWGLY